MWLKMVPFKSLSTVSYSHSIVTMALSCIILEKNKILVENCNFSYFSCIWRPIMGLPSEYCQKICIRFAAETLEWCGYLMVISLLISTRYTNVIEGQTDAAQRHRLHLCRHRVEKCKISVLKVYKTWFARHDFCRMMHMLSADYAVTRCLSVHPSHVALSRKWYKSGPNSYYGMPIWTRTRSIEWWHFQWPWMIPNPDFKVMPFKVMLNVSEMEY